MRHHAAQGWDTSHRTALPAHLQQALATLDRAAEGAPVPAQAIALALHITGDITPGAPASRAELHAAGIRRGRFSLAERRTARRVDRLTHNTTQAP